MGEEWLKAYPVMRHEIEGFTLMATCGGGMLGLGIGLGVATHWYFAIPVVVFGALMIGGCVAAARHMMTRTTFEDDQP